MSQIALLAQGLPTSTSFGLIAALVVFVFFLVILFVFANYFGLWIQSWLTKADITIFNLLGMTF